MQSLPERVRDRRSRWFQHAHNIGLCEERPVRLRPWFTRSHEPAAVAVVPYPREVAARDGVVEREDD